MKFTILMKIDCYIWIATLLLGLSSSEMGSTHICFSGTEILNTEIQCFFCAVKCEFVSLLCAGFPE